MRLNMLRPQAMLANSQAWLTDPAIRDALQAHPLGRSILAEVEVVHDLLAGKLAERRQLEVTLERLGERLARTDHAHDRHARGLYWLLFALAEVAGSEEEAALYRDALALLFPTDLSIVNRSYVEEQGAVLETEKRITTEVRDLLARTMVNGQPLAVYYDRWIAAGKELGTHTRERDRLRSTVARNSEVGMSLDTNNARFEWVRVGQLFLDIVSRLPLDEPVRRCILAPLEQNIAEALASRARANGSDELPDDIQQDGDDTASDRDGGAGDQDDASDPGSLDEPDDLAS